MVIEQLTTVTSSDVLATVLELARHSGQAVAIVTEDDQLKVGVLGLELKAEDWYYNPLPIENIDRLGEEP